MIRPNAKRGASRRKIRGRSRTLPKPNTKKNPYVGSVIAQNSPAQDISMFYFVASPSAVNYKIYGFQFALRGPECLTSDLVVQPGFVPHDAWDTFTGGNQPQAPNSQFNIAILSKQGEYVTVGDLNEKTIFTITTPDVRLTPNFWQDESPNSQQVNLISGQLENGQWTNFSFNYESVEDPTHWTDDMFPDCTGCCDPYVLDCCENPGVCSAKEVCASNCRCYDMKKQLPPHLSNIER